MSVQYPELLFLLDIIGLSFVIIVLRYLVRRYIAYRHWERMTAIVKNVNHGNGTLSNFLECVYAVSFQGKDWVGQDIVSRFNTKTLIPGAGITIALNEKKPSRSVIVRSLWEVFFLPLLTFAPLAIAIIFVTGMHFSWFYKNRF